MIKVSIIMPVLNTEKYIRKALESLVNQTLDDIEIICVDAGSTDRSLSIIKEFINKDKRVNLINSQIKSYGYQMNLGLKKALGEYIGILEPDDFVDLKMFEDLYSTASSYDLDIVKSNYYKYWSNGKREFIEPFKEYKYNEVFSSKEYSKILLSGPYTCTALFKNEFIKKYNINYLETPGASYQDTSFAYISLLMAKRIMILKKGYHNYRIDNVFSSINQNKSKIFCVCDEWDAIDSYIMKNSSITIDMIKYIKVRKFLTFLWNLRRLDETVKNKFKQYFREEFIKEKERGFLDKIYFGDYNWKILENIIINNDKSKICSDVINDLNNEIKLLNEKIKKLKYKEECLKSSIKILMN